MIAACGQMVATTIDEPAIAWPAIARLAAQAAQVRADLLVLPEAAYPAYWLGSIERYMLPDIERSAAALERLSKTAAAHRIWLVAGFVEEESARLFNSAAIFDRRGRLVGVARKNFLWDCDHRWFTPGDDLRVFDTEFGRLGVLICADARVPEIPATLAGDGAQVIVQPTAWVNTSNVRRTYRNIQPDFLIRARAIEFGLPFVCCSKSGREGTVLEYVGQSRIISADGRVLATAALGGEELVYAEITPTRPRPGQVDDALLRRLLSPEPPYRPAASGGKCAVPLKRSADAIAAALESAGARVATLAASDLATFAPARCRALDGAQVLVAQGRVGDDALARARAAENRVFVVIASGEAQRLVDPDGAVLWQQGDWSESLEIDLARADLKRFTPETDIWAGRRVRSYRFGPIPPHP